jgi:transposase
MIVELVESNQKSVSELHREYGVSKVTIYQWMKIYGEDSIQDEPITKEEALKLKQEILKLKEENQILKKAMANFTKNNS